MITLTAIIIVLSLGWVARTLWIHVIAPAMKTLAGREQGGVVEAANVR